MGEHRDPNAWGTAIRSEVDQGPEGRQLTQHWPRRFPSSLFPSQVLLQKASAPTRALPGHTTEPHQRVRGRAKGTVRGQCLPQALTPPAKPGPQTGPEAARRRG